MPYSTRRSGRLELSAALELAPSGWEAWIPASDGAGRLR